MPSKPPGGAGDRCAEEDEYAEADGCGEPPVMREEVIGINEELRRAGEFGI